MKRIGIVGARKYTNKRKIKEFVFGLKERFGDDVEIISGGQPKGADGYAKKYALEFDMKYVEFPPRHYQYNQHCILDRNDYGKSYHVVNFFDRNKQIAEYSDYVVAFIPEGYKSNGTLDTIGHAEKLNKKVALNTVLKSLKNRDKSDRERKHGPLKKTKDSILINTTKLSKKACFMKIKDIMDRKLKA